MTLTDKQKDIIKTINLGHERGHLNRPGNPGD